MSFQSTKIWIKWYEYVNDAFYVLVAFCGLMVTISLIHNIYLIVKKQQVFVANKLSIAFFVSMPIIIVSFLILELWWRINAFYGVSTFYVFYWWHYLLFSGINYVIIFIVWIIKNLYTRKFKEYKEELVVIKNSIIKFSVTSYKKIVHIILYIPKPFKWLSQSISHFYAKLFTKKTVKTEIIDAIKSPIKKGKIIDLKAVNDEVFAKEHLGQGFAVIPNTKKGIFRAPVTGVITKIFHTNHAYNIRTKNGNNLLIHIGINTVQLQGKYYKALKKVKKWVKVGTPIIKANLKKIKAAGYDITTPVVCMPNPKAKIEIDNKLFDKQISITSAIMKII